jgi:hypothetical protein
MGMRCPETGALLNIEPAMQIALWWPIIVASMLAAGLL